MNEKKLNLIEAGLSLFSEKGYHTTSIQEIATKAGISKGAFYLYFESKEDFITTAIHHIHDHISQRLETIKQENLPPKQTLAKQIAIIMDDIYTYKGFITMHMRESISIGDQLGSLMKKMTIQNFQWMQENIQNIYGDRIDALLIDTIIQFEGLMNGYFKWIVIDDIVIDHKKVGHFLVRRLDDIVNGMIKQEEEPLITTNDISVLFETTKQDIKKILNVLGEKINTLPLEKEQINNLNEVLDALANEINKQDTQPFLLQGLLAHFQRFPVLYSECEKIAGLLNIDLLKDV